MLRTSDLVLTLLMLVMATTCYQLFLFRIAGSYLPITALLTFAMVPLLRLGTAKDQLQNALLFYAFWNTVAVLWASVFGIWLYQMVFGNIALICYLAGVRLRRYEQFVTLAKVFVWSGAANAVLVILFRLNPQIEAGFILNYIGLFKNPDRLIDGMRLNVIDPEKAGGVFDNGNTAATFHLVSIGIAMMFKRYTPRATYTLLIALHIGAVVMTGSKSALIILCASLLLAKMMAFMRMPSPDRALRIVILLGVVIIAALLLGTLLNNFFVSDFGQRTASTSGDRASLIAASLHLIAENPIIGIGYGAWGTAVAGVAGQYGILADWPPHNSLLEAWLYGGFLNLVIAVWILVVMIWRSLSNWGIYRSYFRPEGLFVVVMGSVIMPLGDPQPLLGAVQSIPALALAFAAATWVKARNTALPGRAKPTAMTRLRPMAFN